MIDTSSKPSFIEFALKPIIKMIENADIKIDTNMKVKAEYVAIDEENFSIILNFNIPKEKPEPEKKEEKKPDSEGN